MPVSNAYAASFCFDQASIISQISSQPRSPATQWACLGSSR